MKTLNTVTVLLVAALTLAASSASGQILYSNDFSATGLPNADPQFSLGSGVLNYTNNPGAANITATASARSVVIGTSDFIVSTRLTLNDRGTDTANLGTMGFGAFGSTANFLSTGGASYYLADWGINSTTSARGQLRILAQGDTAGFTSASADSDGGNPNGSSVVNGNTYELRLTGTFAGGTLNLTLALFDDLGTQLGTAATATDTSPLLGQFFGYRNRAVNTSGITDISYDNFSVAVVPEPAALALASLGILIFLCRSRSRAPTTR